MTSWTRIVHGLRARPAEGHGIEIQCVRNMRTYGVQVETVEIGDCKWVLSPGELVELLLLASPHRDASEPNKLLVRTELIRILHGTEAP